MDALPQEYRHEPQMALAGGDDGMDLVRRILKRAGLYVAPRAYWYWKSATSARISKPPFHTFRTCVAGLIGSLRPDPPADPRATVAVIRGSGITLRRGTKVLLDGADFVVNPGERVGIVGKNGAGKSSLFALLTGALDVDAGTLSLPPDWRIASVQQELHADERPAREFVIDGDTHAARPAGATRGTAATSRRTRDRRDRKLRWSRPAPGARRRAPSSCWPAWASSRPNGRSRWRAFPAAGACGWRWPAR